MLHSRWALYCNVTRRLADGYNGVTVFFSATAAALWGMAVLGGEPLAVPSGQTWFVVAAAGAGLGAGYALWNVGMLGGDMPLLTTASYAGPLLSTAFAAAWLGAPLTPPFWQGAALVTAGSLLCWRATRPKPDEFDFRRHQTKKRAMPAFLFAQALRISGWRRTW